MRIVVVGGTGLVGRLTVAALADAGHAPVVVARSRGVDVTTGRGLDEALAGAGAVIDVSNTNTTRKAKALEFFRAGTTNLLASGARVGVAHHLILSIVGADRVDFGYYLGKRAQEDLARASARPVSVLRSTQFHEFAEQLLDRARGPVAVVPRMRIQPIAAREVAARLAALATSDPLGSVPDLAGPEPQDLVELVRAVRDARRRRAVVVPLRLPGRAGAAMAGGELLPDGGGARGEQTFADWLQEPTGR